MGKRLARYAWLVEVELQLSASVTEKRYFAIARPDARSAEEAVLQVLGINASDPRKAIRLLSPQEIETIQLGEWTIKSCPLIHR